MLSKIEELTLIGRCVATDDRRAFARLVDAYSPSLHSFLYHLTMGDGALTDDLAQDTFLKAYCGLRSFRATARFRTWLFRIAINEFISYRRRKSEERMVENMPDEGCADKEMMRAEMSHDLQVAMQALSDIERTLILLFYYQDLPLKDIVKITGLPEGTVKSYLSRAKAKMAKTLKKDTDYET